MQRRSRMQPKRHGGSRAVGDEAKQESETAKLSTRRTLVAPGLVERVAKLVSESTANVPRIQANCQRGGGSHDR